MSSIILHTKSANINLLKVKQKKNRKKKTKHNQMNKILPNNAFPAEMHEMFASKISNIGKQKDINRHSNKTKILNQNKKSNKKSLPR